MSCVTPTDSLSLSLLPSGLPDVFCEIECGNQKWTTETSFKTVNPLWRWVHDVEITRSDSIVISLWNAKKVNHGKKKGFMGCVRINPSAISSLKDTGFQRLDLQKLNDDDQDVRGVIIISLLSKDPHSISRHQNNVVIQQQQENNLRPINMIQCVPSTTHGNNTGTSSGGENVNSNAALSRRSGQRSQRSDRDERTTTSSTNATRERCSFERNARSSSARIPKSIDRRPLNATHGNSTSNPQINVLDGQANGSNRSTVNTSSSSVHNNSVNNSHNNNNDNSSHNHNRQNSQSEEAPSSRGNNISVTPGEAATALCESSTSPSSVTNCNARRSSRGHRSRNHSHNIVPASSTTSNLLLRPQLPDGYEVCTTEHGQIYYYHKASDTTTYYDPRVPKQVTDLNLDLDNLFGKLPDGWEMRTAPSSSSNSSHRTYFLNHMTRTTQFTDPRLIQNATRLDEILNESGISGLLNRCKVTTVRSSPNVNSVSNRTLKPPMPLPETSTDLNLCKSSQPIKKNLIAKMQTFKQAIQPLQITNGHCRLEVSRKDIFEDSFTFIMKMKTKELRKKLMVKFRGEEGIDYGGVAREWLHLLSREMLNPQYALFKYTADHIFTLQINPDSGINSVSIAFFFFSGDDCLSTAH